MNRSENINELATALAKAQGQMEAAKKDSENPFFKSKYADLAAVVAAIKKPLADNGLSYSQLVGSYENGGCYVETILMHTSGQWISDRVPVITTKERDPQAFGTAVSYMRRYALQAITGTPAEDDDGNDASGKPALQKSTPPQQRTGPQQAPKDAPPRTTADVQREMTRPTPEKLGPQQPPPEGAGAMPAQGPRKRPTPSGDMEIDGLKFDELREAITAAKDEGSLKVAFLDAYQFAGDIDDDRVAKPWQMHATRLKDERKAALGLK